MDTQQMERSEQYSLDFADQLAKNGNNDSPEEQYLSSLSNAIRLIQRRQALERASRFSEAYWVLLLEQLRTLTRARNVSLYLVKEDRLVPEIWFGDWGDNEEPRVFKRDQGIAGKVWASKEIYISKGDVQEAPGFDHSENPRSQGVRSLICAPIFAFDHRVIGVLNLDSEVTNRFTGRLERRISTLQPRVYAMLRELGMTDAVDERELIAIYFWAFQKAVSHEYVFARGEAEISAESKEAEDQVLLNSEHVDAVFRSIYQELAPGEGKPGPRPVRLERIWEVFKGRENEPIPLDEFEEAFGSRKSAASALSWLNNTFRRWGYDLEIETVHCTEYKLRPRPPVDP